MLKFFTLPLTVLALAVAGPVLAADPAATAGAKHDAMQAPAASPVANSHATVAPKAAVVDVNSATAAEMKALPGITDAEAAKIVQGRPYKEPSDLVSKKILPEAEYNKIKDRLTAGRAKS